MTTLTVEHHYLDRRSDNFWLRVFGLKRTFKDVEARCGFLGDVVLTRNGKKCAVLSVPFADFAVVAQRASAQNQAVLVDTTWPSPRVSAAPCVA